MPKTNLYFSFLKEVFSLRTLSQQTVASYATVAYRKLWRPVSPVGFQTQYPENWTKEIRSRLQWNVELPQKRSHPIICLIYLPSSEEK